MIKLRHAEKEVFLLLYKLDDETEVTSLSCSKKSVIFFNSEHEFMVADPEVGIINIGNKEVMHEYHLQRNWPEEV